MQNLKKNSFFGGVPVRIKSCQQNNEAPPPLYLSTTKTPASDAKYALSEQCRCKAATALTLLTQTHPYLTRTEREREHEREARRRADATGNRNTTGKDPFHRGPTQRGGPRRGPTTGGEGHAGDPHRTHTDKNSSFYLYF